MDIQCFRLGEEYKMYLPHPTQPSVTGGKTRVILAGEPNGIKVWEIIIGPFEELTDGLIVIAERFEILFSTFRVTKE